MSERTVQCLMDFLSFVSFQLVAQLVSVLISSNLKVDLNLCVFFEICLKQALIVADFNNKSSMCIVCL